MNAQIYANARSLIGTNVNDLVDHTYNPNQHNQNQNNNNPNQNNNNQNHNTRTNDTRGTQNAQVASCPTKAAAMAGNTDADKKAQDNKSEVLTGIHQAVCDAKHKRQ